MLIFKNSAKLNNQINQIKTCILDGEIVPYDYTADRYKSFDKMQNLKENANEDLDNLKIMLFDIIMLNDESLIDKTYVERKSVIQGFHLNKRIGVVKSIGLPKDKDFQNKLTEIFEKSKANFAEGLVVKIDNEKYLPGSRLGWIKFKYLKLERNETLDLVIIGGYFGIVRL